LALQAGIWSTDAVPGDIVLRSSTGKLLLQNGALSSALAIRGNNVGIGTTTPLSKLDVRGDIRLGPTGQLRATSGEENLRIVRGVVGSQGNRIAGSGFAVSHPTTGEYTITFTPPFAGVPSVTAMVNLTSPAVHILSTTVTANRCELLSFGNGEGDTDFQFIAVGPR
jgi:hypothetical protein